MPAMREGRLGSPGGGSVDSRLSIRLAAHPAVLIELTQCRPPGVLVIGTHGSHLRISIGKVLVQFLGDLCLSRGIESGSAQLSADLWKPLGHVTPPRCRQCD